MPEPNLTDRTVAGAAWRFGGLLSKYLIRLAVIVVLARLLPPEAFGVVGAATIFAGLTTALMQGGFSAGLVRLAELEDADIRTAFSLAMMQGSAFGALLWFGAPLGGQVFAMDNLAPLLRLLALTPLLAGLGGVSEALLQRGLNFRQLFGADVRSFALGYGLIGVALAVLGYGAWSLAWAAVCQQLFRSVDLYAGVRHSLKPAWARTSLRRLFSFGASDLAANASSYGAANADYAVVARVLGEEALGYYSRAYQLMSVPLNQFSRTAANVLFAGFATIQDDRERLRGAFTGCVALTGLTAFPALTILAVLAPEVVRGILGAAWTSAIRPLQLLCCAGLSLSILTMGNALVRAQGVTAGRAVRDFIYMATVATASWLGSRWGIAGVAAGVAFACLVPYVWTAMLVARRLDLPWRDFFIAQLPGFAFAVLAGAICFGLAGGLRSENLPDLVVLAVSGTLSVAVAGALILVAPDRLLGGPAVWAVSRIKSRLARRSPESV
jgi:PST family polysaccharide transporter